MEKFKNQNNCMVPGLVSVIIPVYNTKENYLELAVDSILAQTYGYLELIIVDDGSTTECAEKCDSISDDSRVKVYHIKNSGVSVARNTGIDKSQGEFITFIDSDDTLAPNAIEIMVREIKEVDFVTIGCEHVQNSFIKKDDDVKGSVVANRNKCIDYLCYMNPPYNHIETNAIWGKLYRRELIGDIRCENEMVIAEDFKFNFDYIAKNDKGKYLDYIGYNYLEHFDSISRSYKPAMIKTIDVIEKMIQDNTNLQIYDALVSRSVNIAFTILMMTSSEFKNEQKRIKNFINQYRVCVIRNKQTKKKVKYAALLSLFGYKTTFWINNRVKDKGIK